jgi:hypothetical protein
MMFEAKDIERFFAKVDRNGPIPAHRPELGPCHVWTASCKRFGHGQFSIRRKMRLAHRVAFLIAHGRWPEPCACHHCDNPACVNVSHLFEGSKSDNNVDALAKGRHVAMRGDRHGRRTKPHQTARGERNGKSKLSDQDVRDIRANYALCRVSRNQLARRFGVSSSTVGKIVTGRAWAQGPHR